MEILLNLLYYAFVCACAFTCVIKYRMIKLMIIDETNVPNPLGTPTVKLVMKFMISNAITNNVMTQAR